MMEEQARRLCLSQERGFKDRFRSRTSGDHYAYANTRDADGILTHREREVPLSGCLFAAV